MLGAKIVLVSGLLITGVSTQIHPMLINMPRANHALGGAISLQQPHTQAKEEVLFDNGNFRIFRTFDEAGKQIFNENVNIKCKEKTI